MSFVNAVPETLDSAATDLARLGSTINAANTAAATQTTSVAAPAQDEVSTAIAALLGTHAQEFQALNAQAARFHDQFVQALNFTQLTRHQDHGALANHGALGNRRRVSAAWPDTSRWIYTNAGSAARRVPESWRHVGIGCRSCSEQYTQPDSASVPPSAQSNWG
jgi:hypothetical protein